MMEENKLEEERRKEGNCLKKILEWENSLTDEMEKV